MIQIRSKLEDDDIILYRPISSYICSPGSNLFFFAKIVWKIREINIWTDYDVLLE